MPENALPRISRKILLADDNEEMQAVVKRVAQERGHQIVQTTRGLSVVDVAVKTQPDLIVLDMDFPDADGRDVLGMLKKDPRTTRIPVVIWSGRQGHEYESDSRISLDLGAEDYIEKGAAQLLLHKLERVLLRLDSKA